jgi:pimeloyl-ACP methyl ester carboxylesterase
MRALFAAALAALSLPLAAQAPTPETLAEFARPHQAVKLPDGRRINLFCMGSGKQTVLFDAGGSDWSVIWGLVQPRVAAHARACSYDRAGLGYSDPAPGPRSPAAIVEDMHALIAAAKLPTPLVLVGHSLGGFNAKLHAALYPGDIAGLVLVDPSEERDAERAHARMVARYGAAATAQIELAGRDGLQGLLDRYRTCQALAKAGDLDPATVQYRRCSDPPREPLGPAVAAERKRIQVKPVYQETQASEILNSVYGRSDTDAAYRALFRPGMFGAKPMIVLTHGNFDPADPADAADFQSYLWLHRDTAALSRAGRQEVVPKTNHNIEIDDPEAVARAIIEVVQRTGG